MVSLCGYRKVVPALGRVVRCTEHLIEGGWADMVSVAIASISV